MNTSVFSSGALRDLSNPHNGGNDFNDAGYQPAHYSERYTGSQDNGGVHINSGIPNKAFQLFADAITKDKAEQVYYRALDLYLLKSSNFVDCRNAIVQAADDLYGTTEVNAANAAFTAVGIGAGAGTDPQTDIDTNPGDDFILMSDADFAALYIFTPTGRKSPTHSPPWRRSAAPASRMTAAPSSMWPTTIPCAASSSTGTPAR